MCVNTIYICILLTQKIPYIPNSILFFRFCRKTSMRPGLVQDFQLNGQLLKLPVITDLQLSQMCGHLVYF